MLRSFLIYLSKARWARRVVTRWQIAWRVASRFVAGETQADAIRVIRELNARGIHATLDHLGEHVTSEAEANRAADEVIAMLDLIEAEGVRSGISIKLSQMGLLLGEEICEANLRRILEHARRKGNFIRIDMEESALTDATLRLFHKMLDEGFGRHVGVVIQAYLYRSQDDLAEIVRRGGFVRLCKGAYKEPPEIAYPKKADVDASYDRLAQVLLDGALDAGAPLASEDGHFPPIPAIASHDEARIAFA
ncbi:MAG: proline dehydrogenase, partial [Anaerolineae bacterium]